MKECSTSLVIMKNGSKPWDITSHVLGQLLLVKWEIISVAGVWKKATLSYTNTAKRESIAKATKEIKNKTTTLLKSPRSIKHPKKINSPIPKDAW
jgi:hypothetical protein